MHTAAAASVKTIAIALSIALIVFDPAAAADSTTEAATYKLNIPSQSLNDALQEFALASRHKLFYQADIVDGKVNPALVGQYTMEEAIHRLLAGTDLSYEISPDGVVSSGPRKVHRFPE